MTTKTFTICSECGYRIPWDWPRVLVEIRKGSYLVVSYEKCVDCASGLEARSPGLEALR